MLTNNLGAISLFAGLLVGIVVLRLLYRRVVAGKNVHAGLVSVCCGLGAVLPVILLKTGVIKQTEVTGWLGIVYFLFFMIGSVLINSKISRREFSEWRE